MSILPGTFPCIYPNIDAGKKDGKAKYRRGRQFKIDKFFHIVGDERAGVGEGRVMPRPQPYFKVGEGTVPPCDLAHQGKGKTSEMEKLHFFEAHSKKRSQYEKEYPKQMQKNSYISQYPVKHLSAPFFKGQTGLPPAAGFIRMFFYRQA